MIPADVATLHERLDIIIRTARHIRQHAGDLHSLAWEPHVGDTEKVRKTKTDYVPRVADEAPRARKVLSRIEAEVASIQGELTGLDRAMLRVFTARAERPDPTRGSTIRVEEFDDLQANQRNRRAAGEYTPNLLESQPDHPGRHR
jgi:hypothetical protein